MADRVLVMHEGRITADTRPRRRHRRARHARRHRTRPEQPTRDHRRPHRPRRQHPRPRTSRPRRPTRARPSPGAQRARSRSPRALVVLVIVTTIAEPAASCSPQGVKDLLLNATILVSWPSARRSSSSPATSTSRSARSSASSAFAHRPLFVDAPGIPIVVVFLVGSCSARCSAPSTALLVTFAKVPALVITLGTLYVYRGINIAWAGGDAVLRRRLPRGVRRLSVDTVARHPDPHDHRRRRGGHRRGLSWRAPAPAATSTRSAPTRRPPRCSASG